jgi:hypothetical protein
MKCHDKAVIVIGGAQGDWRSDHADLLPILKVQPVAFEGG